MIKVSGFRAQGIQTIVAKNTAGFQKTANMQEKGRGTRGRRMRTAEGSAARRGTRTTMSGVWSLSSVASP